MRNVQGSVQPYTFVGQALSNAWMDAQTRGGVADALALNEDFINFIRTVRLAVRGALR